MVEIRLPKIAHNGIKIKENRRKYWKISSEYGIRVSPNLRYEEHNDHHDHHDHHDELYIFLMKPVFSSYFLSL